MSLTLQHRLQFTRQLATLVSAGLPLLQALETMRKSEQRTQFQDLIAHLCVLLEQGVSFHQALNHTDDFDTLYIELVGAAEIAGNLDVVLLRLATLLEQRHRLGSHIRNALTYPCAVLCITIGVVTVILVWVVPVFESIFASLGAELPAMTQAVISASRWFSGDGLTSLFTGLALPWLLLAWLKQQAWFHMWWHTQALRLPLIGSLVHQSQLSIWAQTLSDLLCAGIPLLDALEVVAASSTNRCLGLATLTLRTQVSQGQALADAMRQLSVHPSFAKVFPAVVVQLVDVGEQSGALDALLGKLAEQYNQQLESLLRQFTQLLEPTLMVVLGLIMGVLVVALYLPVFQLGQVL